MTLAKVCTNYSTELISRHFSFIIFACTGVSQMVCGARGHDDSFLVNAALF